ncbi:MAG: phosphate starvation-inducible protein PhoH [Alkaliphilus sp.]|nr:PhoH family protein [bacterium AH-315-G05]MBN4074724.1 PhoH family protein [bacterium AH-315-E09]PHS36416.1 MAG: phosphate starvation-inducible protein PhoH [Alkaliphilus sp.]
MVSTVEKTINIYNAEIIRELFGEYDKKIKLIQQLLNVDISLRQKGIIIVGEEKQVRLCDKLILKLVKIIKNEKNLSLQQIRYVINSIGKESENNFEDLKNEVVFVTEKGKPIKPMTLGQKEYLETIKSKDLTLAVGPAGTGKTYLAVAMAVKALRNEEVSRIILTRPAVEAGESLGFLPGDMKEKVDPYLRPLFDALFDILGADKFEKYMDRDIIEVAPLAFMRGRTLNYAFIILDEAQNTTKEQMKMFLTRLGVGSKIVVTGDITQIDLPKAKNCGLVHATKVLKDMEEVGIQLLTKKDVVRHTLVRKIIAAYEKNESDN